MCQQVSLRWRCGTLKRVVCYFEELSRAVWFFDEGGATCGTLKRAVCYFEESGVVL